MDPWNEKITGGDRSEFYVNYERIFKSLPRDKKLQLSKARVYYVKVGGLNAGAAFYEASNGFSPEEIVRKSNSCNDKIVASGNIDSTRFALRRTPLREKDRSEQDDF